MAFEVYRGKRSEAARAGAPVLGALFALLLVHASVLIAFPYKAVVFSRLLTAAVPIFAAGCAFWRGTRVADRERFSWYCVATAALLWAAGQIIGTILPGAQPASLVSEVSDMLYLVAALPVMLAISRTEENESAPGILYLNLAQFGLAAVLIYYRIFRVSASPAAASSAEIWIYDWESVLLAISAAVRYTCWTSREERDRIRCLAGTVCIFAPIELGMDYATVRWHLVEGTPLDLLWSLPFLFAAWQILKLPEGSSWSEVRQLPSRPSLLAQSLCPLLMTVALYVLASSLLGSHALLARVSILILLLLQGLHAGIVQMHYFSGQQQLRQREHELEVVNAGLFHLSHIDPLTGIANRRGFSDALQAAWLLAAREHRPIALVMIDLDLFKAINDRYGHGYGDECLIAVARTLLIQGARAGDHLARYGGEEFVLLLPNTDLEGACAVADRMHRAVAAAGIVNVDSPYAKRLTVSIGVTATQPNLAMAAGSLIEAADQALYEAKRGGRNRVCTHVLPERLVSAAV